MTEVAPDGIIRVMPEALANKIAAGEVVQRPASVVKELVENAIDAGADEISVVVRAAGSELIQVVDNGCGMSPADAALAFQRHATSKLLSAEDLEQIETLGFRGEALASIGAVARVELRTKRSIDPAGTLVEANGGRIQPPEPCAMPEGTSVAVRNLFYNVPARRNFLKTPATEFRHIVETFQFLALSHPEIAFSLFHEGNEVHRLAAERESEFHTALARRVEALFGNEAEGQFIPVEETTSYLSIRGLTGRPSFYRRSRGEQFLFVNGRFVRSRYLDHAVQHAYDQLLPEGSYPFYVLFLTLDARHVDVNVHPTKAEVKFDDERGVYGFVRAVIRKELGMADLAPQFDPGDESHDATAFSRTFPAAQPFQTPTGGWDAGQGGGAGWRQPERPQRDLLGGLTPGEISQRLYGGEMPAGGIVPSAVLPEEGDEDTPPDEGLLWQLHDRYILTQIRTGMMILDQNAAHERILYERALQSIGNGLGLSQQLLFPHTVDVNPADHALLQELLPDLRSLGFDLEFFSGRSVVVRGVPTDIRPGDERTILEDVLAQYKDYRDSLSLKGHENLARSIARRSAIRPGKRLSTKEMRALIDQLFMCRMPYACPHGRPTMIKISLEELARRFR